MPTIRFISHNCAAKAPRDQKNKPGKLPAFIEEVPSKRLFADDEVADFIAKNLPPKDWWIFGVRPEDGEDVSSERKREGQARATIKERLQEYDCRWLKSKANQTARAMIAKGGGVLYEDERDELELPDPYDDDGDYSGSETDPVTGFIESDAPLPHTQSQFAIAASRPDQKLYAEQNYLHAAPFGVDAPAGWNASGNDPSEVVLGVVDEGWTEEHVEFKNVKQFTTLGEIDPEGRGHGTAVLAIICAENAGGSDLFGVVPNLKSIVMSSPWMANGGHPTRGSKAAAIAWAACQLAKNNQRGNVLLIEAQTRVKKLLLPVEVDLLTYAVISAATNAGVIVVEPGGNGRIANDGHVDFDDFLVYRWCRKLKRPRIEFPLAPNRAGYRDSGAIIVGAVSLDVPHRRLPFSPLGNRVDVWAPGAQVVTADSYALHREPTTLPELDPTIVSEEKAATDVYQAGFGGTSAAAAIVAGVAAALQDACDKKGRRRLKPDEMRELFKRRGTLCFDDRTNVVLGRMPDLKKLLELL